MKWLWACLVLLFMIAPAMAGEDPYIGIVGLDKAEYNHFYFSPEQEQFLFDTVAWSIPQVFGIFPPVTQYTRVGGTGDEQFRSQMPNNQAEVCDVTDLARGLPNARTPAGNAGFYEWFIRLPRKPSGEINLVIRCGVLMPNALSFFHSEAVELCAAETGERIGAGLCVRERVGAGVNPLITIALPKITAIAYPGPYNVAFNPFYLTAFKNPSSYQLTLDSYNSAMSNNDTVQVLNGSSSARILLKACTDKTVVMKLPVTGQLNALGERETDLEAGDLIYMRVDVPRQNTVDIYCHQQSVRLAGVGETPF